VLQQLGSLGSQGQGKVGQYQFRLIDGQTDAPLWVSPVHAL